MTKFEYNPNPDSDEEKALRKRTKDGDPVLGEIHDQIDAELKEFHRKNRKGSLTKEERSRYESLIEQWIPPNEDGEVNPN